MHTIQSAGFMALPGAARAPARPSESPAAKASDRCAALVQADRRSVRAANRRTRASAGLGREFLAAWLVVAALLMLIAAALPGPRSGAPVVARPILPSAAPVVAARLPASATPISLSAPAGPATAGE